MKKLSLYLTLNLLFITFVTITGCSDSNDSDNSDSNDTDSVCTPKMPTGTGKNGDHCLEMEDCASGFCTTSSHAPADKDAICAKAPAVGDIHLLSTLTDFMTGDIIPNQTLKVGGGFDVSQNPTGFPVAAEITSDKNGKIDELLTGKTTKLPLAIVVVGEAKDYYPTSTGVSTPEAGCGIYPPATRNADLKMIKKADLTALSDALKNSYPDESDNLPLGDKGGVLGVIKFVETGAGVKDTVVKSTIDTSKTRIYYLNKAQDGFTKDKTSENGIFILIKAGLAEEFVAYKNNKIISRRPATAGETSGVLFTTTIQVDKQ